MAFYRWQAPWANSALTYVRSLEPRQYDDGRVHKSGTLGVAPGPAGDASGRCPSRSLQHQAPAHPGSVLATLTPYPDLLIAAEACQPLR